MFCLLLAATPPSSVAGQQLTAESVVGLTEVSSVAMQPNGDNVAFVQRTPRVASDSPGSAFVDIAIVPAQGGTSHRLLRPASASNLTWSRDGTQLVFFGRLTASEPVSRL